MRPYVSERDVQLLSQLYTIKEQVYAAVKRYILSQLRLTPRALLNKFNNTNRTNRLPEETAVLFASRLKTLLQYYRNMKDFKQLTFFTSLQSIKVFIE